VEGALRAGVFALLVACAQAPAVPTPGQRITLSYGGTPIGDVEGNLDVFTAPGLVRVTVRGPRAVVHIDRTASEVFAKPPPAPSTSRRFELCLDRALVPLALGNAPPPTTIELLGKTFVVDAPELCFDDGDVARSFVAVAAHWDAPDGTRVIVEAPVADPSRRTRLRSEPPRPEADILKLLLVPSPS
jgi:hypothetical protein